MTLEDLTFEFNLTEKQIKQLKQYSEYLIQQNKVMNLTAITDMNEVFEKHFKDSLLIDEFIQGYSTFCDVGSGAGFPGMVLAIKNPLIEFTLLEPTKKRCRFLEEVIELLDLPNVKVVNNRAEDFSLEAREQFDVVSARAVANLVMLSELCLPLVRVGGIFIAMKGQKGLEELEDAKWAINTLGGAVNKSEVSLLSDESLRYNIIIDKRAVSPKKYPRNFGQIKNKPLTNKRGG